MPLVLQTKEAYWPLYFAVPSLIYLSGGAVG